MNGVKIQLIVKFIAGNLREIICIIGNRRRGKMFTKVSKKEVKICNHCHRQVAVCEHCNTKFEEGNVIICEFRHHFHKNCEATADNNG